MINWKILGKRSTYNILIKLKSASYRETNMVKRRTEVISKCKTKTFLFACYHSKGKACVPSQTFCMTFHCRNIVKSDGFDTLGQSIGCLERRPLYKMTSKEFKEQCVE